MMVNGTTDETDNYLIAFGGSSSLTYLSHFEKKKRLVHYWTNFPPRNQYNFNNNIFFFFLESQ